MISPEQVARNQDGVRAEGRKARLAGVPVADCPYSLAAPKDDRFGIQFGVEWLWGWRVQNELMKP